ncbi:MAG: translation initiation factor eIF 4e-like domain-containing protein [Linnemannia gamsii]|nr:MAG: translation initiation factor eIF 4e-like domain-containing protein [Linnemannia gamsii]
MRRTASHNNAFSSGLGVPMSGGASTGHFNGSAHSNLTLHSNGSNGHGPSTNGLPTSPVLAPFSLGQMTRSTRRSSLNPPDSGATHNQDHASPSPISTLPASMVDKHPLQHPWTLYYTAAISRQGSSLHIYENGLREMGTFTTVELFARYFNWIEKPHKIENSSDYHLFKDGIKPMWEDPANANGGRWIVTLLTKNPDLLDRCWMELAYALVGEQLDIGDDICGAVLSRRTKADRLAVWVRDKDNVDAINGIGKRLVKLLDLRKETISMEFLITTESKSSGLLKKYITLDTIKAELAQEAEAQATHTLTGNETTPSLTIDSVSVTPASATEVSPATPGLSQGSSTLEKENGEETPTAVGTSGLLISVDGKGVFAV